MKRWMGRVMALLDPRIDDVREAVFRYQFESIGLDAPQDQHVYYLQYGNDPGRSPSAKFLARFAGFDPPVRPLSHCRADTKGVWDKKTGERGLILRAGPISKVSDTAFDVEGGFFDMGLSASGNTYRVELVDGRWVVTKDTLHWYS